MTIFYYPKPDVMVGTNGIDLTQSCVIEASAGTGKTYTLERLIVGILLETDTPLEKILVVTFTRRATSEMKWRIRKFVNEILHSSSTEVPQNPHTHWRIDASARARLEAALHAFDRAQIFTIHAFCQQWLSRYAFEIGGLFNGKLTNEDELLERAFYDVLRKVYAKDENSKIWLQHWLGSGKSIDDLKEALSTRHGNPAPLLPEFSDAERAELQALDIEAASDDKTAKAQLQTCVIQTFYPVLQDRIAQIKSDSGVYSYDDMIADIHRAVSGPASGMLRAMRQAYDFGLIDEFQDTDPLQWDIFKRIFDQKPLYLIGDPKQSIYGFRGADIATYREATEATTHRVPLTKNFRSTPRMIDAYNAVFTHESFFSVPADYKDPVTAGNAPAHNDERPIRLLRVSLKEKPALISAIASEIHALITTQHVPANEIFVLTRTNKNGDQIAKELAKRGIKFGFFRQGGLFQTTEARHIADLLCALANPQDDAKRRLAMLGPFFGVELPLLKAADEDRSHKYTPRSRFTKWSMLADARQYTVLFGSLLYGSGLMRRQIFAAPSERQLTNYEHIFELLQNEVTRRQLSPSDLHAWLKAQIENKVSDDDPNSGLQRMETEENAVQLMTMHKCKGLQAEVVFIYDECGDPGKNNWRFVYKDKQKVRFLNTETMSPEEKEDAKNLVRAEDERLFYVAMTRAKRLLYMPLFMAKDGDVLQNERYFVNQILGTFQDDPRFECIDVSAPETDATQEVLEAHLSLWSPGQTAIVPPPEKAEFQTVKARELSYESYSSLAHSKTSSDTNPRIPAEDGQLPWEHAKSPGFLTPGAKSGLFLHEIMEHLDYTLARATDFGTWRALPEVSALMERLVHGYFERSKNRDAYRLYAEEVVYNTLTAPIQLGDLNARIADLNPATTRREVEFVFAIPKDTQTDAERGFINGIIDLLFEHNGKLYFADWKSDAFEYDDYSDSRVNARVKDKYPTQANLYTLALIRMLNIQTREDYEAQFGGYFYFFMRGMNRADTSTNLTSNPGIFYGRPDFAVVQSRSDEIASLEDWRAPLTRPFHEGAAE